MMLICSQSLYVGGNDSISHNISLNYYLDLSDTYGGGSLFSGEYAISRSWYGAKITFGHFQSQYTFLFKVPYEEIGKVLEIPIQEMSFMKTGALSGFIRPIQRRWITVDIVFGAAFSKAHSFYLKGIDYSYDLIENRFIYLIKDYQLVKRNHFGYQVGIDVSFYFLKRIGIQLDTRIQDLNNGGTFFFVGGGFCFRL